MEFPNGFAPFTAEHPPVRGQAAANGAREKPASGSGVLEVEVHQARNLHNICIYAKQDVYAKLSLNDGVDGSEPTAFYTEVVDKGGKDPVFNQKFRTSLVQSDRVLRCEVWMASKMRDYLQDQLLGAVTIALSTLVGKEKEFGEFELSSTELFHSPAGSVSMTLQFKEDTGIVKLGAKASPESNDCEVTVCNSTTSNLSASSVDGIDSKLVTFADLADAREDEELVSDFIQRKQNVEAAAKDDGIYTGPPYLKLAVGKSLAAEEQSEDGVHVSEPDDEHSVVEEGTDKLFSAPAASGGEKEKSSKPGLKQLDVPASPSLLESAVSNGITPSSKPQEDPSINKADEEKLNRAPELGNGGEAGVMSDEEAAKYGFVSKPVIQPEPRIMQQEIMDMYTKSMQQFSDALAKMQLPVDENGLIKLDEGSSETTDSKETKNTNGNNSSSGSERSGESSGGGKRNSTSSNTPRLFYGSRAFF